MCSLFSYRQYEMSYYHNYYTIYPYTLYDDVSEIKTGDNYITHNDILHLFQLMMAYHRI